MNPKCLYRNISIEDIFLQDVYIFIKVSNHLTNSLHDFLFFIFYFFENNSIDFERYYVGFV